MSTFRGIYNGTTEAQLKQFFAYLFSPAGGTAATGVVSGLAVSQTTTASGSVNVSAGMGVVQDALLSGVTPLVNNAVQAVDVFTGSPMAAVGNPRNDIVVFNGSTGNIEALIGTPNASPTDPTVPATSLKLARLRHAANATTIPAAKIDDLRVFTGLLAFPADTGWKDIPLSAGGFTVPPGSVRWQVRQYAGVVYFRGSLQNSAYTANYGVVGTLPAGITLPTTPCALTVSTNTSSKHAVQVMANGDVQVYTEAATVAWYTISGSYPVG